MDDLEERLSKSKFRERFHLKDDDKYYVYRRGLGTIRDQAFKFVNERLRSPVNDGRQTPMKGHPVFVSQHHTATCCRGCLEKWHHIEKTHPLTDDEVEYVVGIIMDYIEKEMEGYELKSGDQLTLF